MRRYAETRDCSSELLRIVIPMMAPHEAGFHPVSYAVWYEYAAGTNQPLKEAVDQRIASGQPLDDEAIHALYEAFIDPAKHPDPKKLLGELERVLKEMTGQAASAGAQAESYGTSLKQFGECLEPGAGHDALRSAVAVIIDDTQAMKTKTGELHQQLQGSTEEIQSLRAELTRVKKEALTDPLTGIANRRGFEQAMADAMAANDGQLNGFCLLSIDIDHFKKCNDTYGHLFGDKVIRAIARIISGNVKGRDTPARIGGEEFLVLLPDTPQDGAYILAERIRTMVSTGRIRRGNSGELIGNITISVGVTQYVPGEPLELFITRADEALYAAKSGGRNRVMASIRPATLEALPDPARRMARAAAALVVG